MENEDRDIVSLLVRLQLEDLALLAASSKGKGRLGILTDGEVAADLYRQELEHLSQVSADRQLVLSHEAAIRTDHDVLETYAAREEAEARDREAARNLSRGIPLSTPHPSAPRATSSSTGAASRSAPTTGSNSSASAPSPSSQPSGTLPPPPPYTPLSRAKSLAQAQPPPRKTSTSSQQVRGSSDRVECVICTDRVVAFRAIEVPCGHNYCRECLKDLFLQSTTNERLMPPSCDRQPIPLALAQPFLSLEQLEQFKAKEIEYATSNRLYCYQPTCSRFLGPSSATKRAVVCGECTSRTCEACKSPWHGYERACAADTDEEAFAALSKELGCQRCPGCRRIVQLDTGCFHMTCICRTQFCLLCAALWKSCRCEQWEERRLYSEAERRVLERAGDNFIPHNIFRQRVEAAATALRDDHECVNHSWRYRPGGGECQECGHTLPSFLMRCMNCQMVACKRCTLNRL